MNKLKFLPLLLAAGLAVSCDVQTGTPNDPNEQQGNPKAQPAESVRNTSNEEPSDNQAGRNAHTDLENGINNQ